jgi:hypothetical protein
MEAAIISGNSKKDFQLLVTIAEKMGMNVKYLTSDDLEFFGMAKAIEEGKTGTYIDSDEFLSSLK